METEQESIEQQMRQALEAIFHHAEDAIKRAEDGGDVLAIHEVEFRALQRIYRQVVIVIGFPQDSTD